MRQQSDWLIKAATVVSTRVITLPASGKKGEEGERATEEDRRVDGAFEGKLLIIAALSGDTNMRSRLLANCL